LKYLTECFGNIEENTHSQYFCTIDSSHVLKNAKILNNTIKARHDHSREDNSGTDSDCTGI